jgi:hypothetical protein
MTGAFDPAPAVVWLTEAFETGNALADLPPDIAPASVGDGEDIAFATLEALGIAPCGLRLLDGLVGPMVEGKLLPSHLPVALGALRHPRVTAAVIGVLAEPLEEGAVSPPVLAGLHPAIDVADSRFTHRPTAAPLMAADLALLGHVVAGRRRAVPLAPIRVLLGPPGSRRTAHAANLPARFAEAAAAARRLGGLPAGALLVVAGLTPAMDPAPTLAADLGPLGKVTATFA